METASSRTSAERERAIVLLFGSRRPALAAGKPFERAVREAFHRRALETHPDRARALGRSEASLEGEFRRVLEAYELLSRREDPAPGPAASPPRPAAPREPRPAPARAPSSGPRPAPSRGGDHRSASPLPQRALLLAEFLYHSGRISWRDLVDAIAWQRAQRPAIGRLAVEMGFLTEEEVRAILARRRGSGVDEPFGEFARRNRFLTGAQVLALLGGQRRMQRRIGEFFVERGILTPAELTVLDAERARHNARFPP